MKLISIFLAAMAVALVTIPASAAEDVVNIRIQVFVFSVDEKIGQFLLSERTDDTELFGEMMSRYKEDEAELVTTASVVARSGQRAKVEGVQEIIYATEFEEAEDGGINPTAFETRNVGTILEVDPVLGADGETIDINLVPEHHLALPVMMNVLEEGEAEKGGNTVAMPKFFVEKVTTATTLRNREARLLGTMDPSAALKGSAEEEAVKDQLHLFFVKVDLVR